MKLPFCILLAATALTLTLPLSAQKRAVVPAEMAPRPGSAPLFSPGILVDGTLYVSGEMGTDLKTRQIPDDFDQEVKNALDSIGLILKEGGMSYADVVSVTVYLSDMELFGQMNKVYTTYFKDPRPARSTVGVAKLASPKGRIEISVVARKTP